MQKLEEIMRAEDEARHTVASARERADALIREAEATARRQVEQSRADVEQAAATLREQRLDAARTEAAEVTERAEREMLATLGDARTRLDSAVEAALEKLRG
jgi:vacuolar-type H+-ATPase subunit H